MISEFNYKLKSIETNDIKAMDDSNSSKPRKEFLSYGKSTR